MVDSIMSEFIQSACAKIHDACDESVITAKSMIKLLNQIYNDDFKSRMAAPKTRRHERPPNAPVVTSIFTQFCVAHKNIADKIKTKKEYNDADSKGRRKMVMAAYQKAFKKIDPDEKEAFKAKFDEAKKKMALYKKTDEYKKWIEEHPRTPRSSRTNTVNPKPKCVNGPKPPLSAFFKFLDEHKGKGNSSQELSAKWSEMTTDEKTKYNDEYANEMAKYKKKMTKFLKTDDGIAYTREIEAWKKRRDAIKKKNPPPVRPKTAYTNFYNDEKSNYEGVNATEYKPKIRADWIRIKKGEDATDEEKKRVEKFEKKAKKALALYNEQKKEWQKTVTMPDDSDISNDESDDDESNVSTDVESDESSDETNDDENDVLAGTADE